MQRKNFDFIILLCSYVIMQYFSILVKHYAYKSYNYCANMHHIVEIQVLPNLMTYNPVAIHLWGIQNQ